MFSAHLCHFSTKFCALIDTVSVSVSGLLYLFPYLLLYVICVSYNSTVIYTDLSCLYLSAVFLMAPYCHY